MSKKVQKTLTAALATTLATGSMAIPAMAETKDANVDDLYKAAYEATIKTQDLEKVTQAEINVAREAIDAIRETSVASAVPTFSAIVDKAQQKFLEVAYNSIVKCQETGTQKDINTARSNIQDLPLQFKNPYSMAIDVVQQKVIDKVYAAVEEAIKTQKSEDIKKAQALLDDILTVVHNDGVKKWAVETEVRFKKATAVLNIVSAEALNNNTVRVVFNRPVDVKTVIAKNFSVSPKGEAYNNLIVDKVQVAKDGMSVDLTTINKFENKKDYVVNVSNLKDTFGNAIVKDASAEFNYQIAAVKSIEFTASNIPTKANLKNYVVIKDALGRDVTDQYKNQLSFTSSNENLVDNNGDVIETKPEEGKNRVVVTVTVDGTDIKTTKTLSITESAAETFEGYAIVKNTVEIGNKTLSQIPQADKLSYVSVGQDDVKLVLGFKDQFGKELNVVEGAKTPEVNGFVVVQNYKPEVATVKKDGTIEALSEGNAWVKVKYGNVEKTIEIKVEAASVPGSISIANDNYNLVATNISGININYAINDQYGSKYNGNKDVYSFNRKTNEFNTTADTSKPSSNQTITSWTMKNSSGNIVTSQFDIDPNAENGQISVKANQGIKTGTYKLTLERKFKYQGNTTTVDRTITINVIEGGEFENYKVQIDHTKLNTNPSANNPTGIPQTANVTVYKVDAAGNELGTVEFSSDNTVQSDKVSLEVLKDGVVSDGLKVSGNTITAEDSGTYTVNVKVGSHLEKQITITVVDTKSEPKCIQFGSKNITINDEINDKNMYYTTINNLFNTKLNPSIKDQYGNIISKSKIIGINYTTSDVKGIKVITNKVDNLKDKLQFTGDNHGVATSQGTMDILVKSIKVSYPNPDKTATDKTLTKTLYYNTPLKISVTINPAKAVLDNKIKLNASPMSGTLKDGQYLRDLQGLKGNIENSVDQYGRSMKVDMSKIQIDYHCAPEPAENTDKTVKYFGNDANNANKGKVELKSDVNEGNINLKVKSVIYKGANATQRIDLQANGTTLNLTVNK